MSPAEAVAPPGKAAKKKPLHGRGFGCCCVADQPPTAKYHYLQLLGTYFVATVPAVAFIDCATAVVLAAEVQAQSILPDRDEADPNAVSVPALLMYGESRTLFEVAVNCGIAVEL
jgi:hypothetical protein